MIIKNLEQLNKLKQSGKILAEVLGIVAQAVKPGVSSLDLDTLAETEIVKRGATPSFKNYRGRKDEPAFPASLCVSINQEIVHGMPRKDKILKQGDIVGLDLGVNFQGAYSDMAVTVGVGKIGKLEQEIIDATSETLDAALNQVKAGNTTGDIGYATELTAKSYGFNVVRDLVGHGVGASVHEEPEVPCFGERGRGTKLVEGLVIAIEPMLVAGNHQIHVAEDNWTIETSDKKLSAHKEHTVLVTKTGFELLTKI
jgi:methionyl aminopeptidase